MISITLAAKYQSTVYNVAMRKGESDVFSVDFSAPAQDDGDVSSAAWTVEAGDVTISDDSVTDNVVSATVTASEAGRNTVRVTTVMDNRTMVIDFDLRVNDPLTIDTDDYRTS